MTNKQLLKDIRQLKKVLYKYRFNKEYYKAYYIFYCECQDFIYTVDHKGNTKSYRKFLDDIETHNAGLMSYDEIQRALKILNKGLNK